MISAETGLALYQSRGDLLAEDKKPGLDFNKAATYWPELAMAEIQSGQEVPVHDASSLRLQQRPQVSLTEPESYAQEDQAEDGLLFAEQDRSARPKRKRISPQQLDVLLTLFQQTDTPSYEQRERVAAHLSMSNREVQVWFQNRRAKERNAKQKQQLMEHRERLERVESAATLQETINTPPLAPVSPVMYALSSPAHATSDFLPQSFDTTRRRSLSTSALDIPTSSGSEPTRAGYHSIYAGMHQPQPLGPMRPRFNRYHTIHPKYAFGRPSSARADMPSSSRSPPSRLTQLEDTEGEAVNSGETAQAPEGLMLPLPQPRYRFGHSPTSSFSRNRPASAASDTIADRRETRLPPIRMLLDIADGALADLSPSTSGHQSSHSCSLYSPFSDLQLNTPGSQDGRRTDYFSAGPQPVREETGGIATPDYSFGRNFH